MATLQFCTTSSRRYLPYARALARSIQRTNPSSTLFVLLTDDHHHEVDARNEPFQCVWSEQIGIPIDELHRMFLIHADDFHIAIKPWITEYTLRETGGPAMFIDSDIQVYGPLDDVGELIEEHGVVLTPHLLSPLPLDGLQPDDTTILSAGTFNAGMIGVGRRGTALIEFLQSRLRRECYVDVKEMRVGEQRWLDFAPSFMHLHVLRDLGINVAYWNLHERPLARVERQITAGGFPLRTYHFSGHDLDRPDVVSRHAGDRPRVQMEREPILAELCGAYRAAIVEGGVEASKSIPVAFDALPGGIPIDKVLRAVFRASVLHCEAHGIAYPPDPYDLEQREAFISWAATTYPQAGVEPPAWSKRVETKASDELGELVRQLAASSSAALANLDARVSQLERLLESVLVDSAR